MVFAMEKLRQFFKSHAPESLVLHLQALDHYFNGEQELKFIRSLCDPHRDAVDAGANIGTYSYFLRRHARKVYAYEPNPVLAARLHRLLADVTVRHAALSDRTGRVVLQVPVNADGAVQHELASITQQFGVKTIDYPVEAITLDSEHHSNVGFLKVDVEQHELAVLSGALGTIQRCRPVVMTEISPLKYAEGLVRAFSFITELGYEGWFSFNGSWDRLTNFQPNLHASASNFGKGRDFIGGNLLLFPSEHSLAHIGPHQGLR